MNAKQTHKEADAQLSFLLSSRKWAVEAIKEKIDGEGKFDAKAPYEMTGAQLREYLAYAYRCGKIAGNVK